MAYTGTGTEQDPYLVANLTDFLECVQKNGVYVKVVTDIDANDDENYNGQIETPIEISCTRLYADSLRIIKNITVYSNYFMYSHSENSMNNIYFQDCVHKTNNNSGYLIYRDGTGITLSYVKFSIRVVGESLNVYKTFDSNVYLNHCAFDVDMVSSTNITVNDDGGREKYCNFIYRNFRFANYNTMDTIFRNPVYSAILLVDCVFGNNGQVYLARGQAEESYFAIINPTFPIGEIFYVSVNQGINVLATAFAGSASSSTTYSFINATEVVTPEHLKDEAYLREIGFLP